MMHSSPSQATTAIAHWLTSELGQSLQQLEARIVEQALDGVFGEQCLQLGLWGESRSFLKFARTQRCGSIAPCEGGGDGALPSVFGELHQLPVASDSIDAVILPHTLEFSDRPHAILREVQRVLRSDGHLIVLGFKPGGLWGLRRLLPGAALPPAIDSLISDRRMTDWLELLDMRIQLRERYFFRWPVSGNRGSGSPVWERRGQRWWPELAACYMLKAQKRVITLTPVRKPWRMQPKVVGGLVEPTSRVTRIHVDRE
ncbi:MAG: methyltransferase domain-containing protein [Woeseia sp.]